MRGGYKRIQAKRIKGEVFQKLRLDLEREYDIDKTVKLLFARIPGLKQYKEHICTENKCKLLNPMRFMSKSEAHDQGIYPHVWMCKYQKIHICDHYCVGTSTAVFNEGKLCEITKVQKMTFSQTRETTSKAGENITIHELVDSATSFNVSFLAYRDTYYNKKYNIEKEGNTQNYSAIEFGDNYVSARAVFSDTLIYTPRAQKYKFVDHTTSKRFIKGANLCTVDKNDRKQTLSCLKLRSKFEVSKRMVHLFSYNLYTNTLMHCAGNYKKSVNPRKNGPSKNGPSKNGPSKIGPSGIGPNGIGPSGISPSEILCKLSYKFQKELYSSLGMDGGLAKKFARRLAFGEYNFSMQAMSFTNIIFNIFRDIDLKKCQTFKLIKTTEIILQSVLPGIHRINNNIKYLLSYQCMLYGKAYAYAEYCIRNKVVMCQYFMLNLLDYSRHPKAMDFCSWVTDVQWLRYLDIMVTSYLFFKIIATHFEGESKNMDYTKHVVGMLHFLKNGYSVTKSVGAYTIHKTVIPRDTYLNKIGVLYNVNKMEKECLLIQKGTIEKGKTQIEKCLAQALYIYTPEEISERLFFNETKNLKKS